MTPRPRLRTIELTAHRAAFRRTLTWVIIAASVVAGVGYMLPAHQLTDEEGFHSNYNDGGPLSLVVLAAVVVVAFALRRFRLGSGMITGVVGIVGVFGALIPVLLAHLLSGVEESYGELVFAAGELTLLFTSATLIVVEPILYILERRRIVREARPAELPVATIHSR